MPVRTSHAYQKYSHLSSPALVAKLSWGKDYKTNQQHEEINFEENEDEEFFEELEKCFAVFNHTANDGGTEENVEKEEDNDILNRDSLDDEEDESLNSQTESMSHEHMEEDNLGNMELYNNSQQCLPERLSNNTTLFHNDIQEGEKLYSEDIDKIFLKYFEPYHEDPLENTDGHEIGGCYDEKHGSYDYHKSESSDSAVEMMTEEEELFHDPGRYFTEMINEVFGHDGLGSSTSTRRRKIHSTSKEGKGIEVKKEPSNLIVPLIPLYTSPPLVSLSPTNGEVKSKVSKFENYISKENHYEPSLSKSSKNQLWFHKDGIRSSPSPGEEDIHHISTSIIQSPRDVLPQEKPPIHPKSPTSPRLRRQKSPALPKKDYPSSDQEQPKNCLAESNRILRNSLGKMEPSERIKLEEILDMCIEYERQIESQMESKGNGVDPNRTPSSSNGGYASLMPLHSPNGSLQPKGIKTNGSLPREKRQVSPNTEPENIIFNFEGLAKVNEESFLIPPSSPRTRIRTYLGSNNGTSSSSRFSSPPPPPVVNEPCSPLEGGITNEDASSSSPSSTVCRKPPRSKHDQGPSSPIKDCEDQFQPLPSEEASSRMLIGTTMLNHKLTGNSILRNGLSPVASSSPPGSKTPLQEFNKSYKIVDTLKSQRHAQILLLSAVKRQLSDLESEAAEGLKELELERSLILGEREAEASELDKLKLRCNQLKTQEARLSGVFQELQKSLSRKTDSAKHKIIEAEDEIKRLLKSRLEGLLSKKETEEEEHYILMHLKEQYEILDNETKAFEDLEFHQMEEETSKETEREELLKEISDVEALVNEKLKKLEEIDFQRKKILYNARNETQSLLAQRQKLLCDLDREKIKLSSIERKLSSYFLSDKEQLVMDDGDYYEEARGMEEDHRHTIVSTSSMEEEEEENGNHWNKPSELDHALKRLNLFGGEDNIDSGSSSIPGILHTNGNSCESGKISSESISEHSTTVEYSEDEGIRVSVSSSYQESNERLRKSGSNQHKIVRPLTRYLPIRNEAFDLRVHIESAGHPLDSNPAVSRHILLNSSSCRGHLYKMSSKFRKWNRRWFVFDRNKRTLIYYSDKTETKAKGGIYFESIEDVYVDHLNSLKSHKPKETFLMKTRDRLYCLMAPTIETMRIWIDVIFTGAEGFQGYHK
ncbi:uncharacterized protein [Lepeophtheirus salmonis]|uniref:uncharacterized protein isoform X3 n=1 Tax=Lepeophtheirus salmonis TaxID=72036 RepID=UPI001AE67FD8|nr:uncharacterized protein LOC121124807 isoform X3 [Lepeophtheirus salmonis]